MTRFDATMTSFWARLGWKLSPSWAHFYGGGVIGLGIALLLLILFFSGWQP